MGENIFFLPEFQTDNPSFYLQNGKRTSPITYPIKGFKLYLFTEALGNFSAPYTIQAVPSSEYTTSFFSVQFNYRPDFEKYGLRVLNHENHQIVYMDSSELVKHPDAIFLDNCDWLKNGFKYHAIGAFHDLGIIHTLSQSLFLNPYCLESNEKDLFIQYGMNGTVNSSLGRIFSDSYFALEFFGFMQTDDDDIQRALQNASLIAQQTKTADFDCLFDFGTIRFAFARYHKSGFPTRMVDPRIVTSDTHRELLDIVHHVAQMLRNLGYPVMDDEFKSGLKMNIEQFKKQNSIDEQYCGRKTLRALIFSTSSFDRKYLELAAGIESKSDIENIEVNAMPRFVGIPAVTKLIDTIPDLQNVIVQLKHEISRTTSHTMSSCGKLNERLIQCDKRLNTIMTTLRSLSEKSSIIDEKLEIAGNSLEEVMDAHSNVEDELIELSKKINTEYRGNIVFKLIPAIIVILVLKKFIMFLFR